MNFYNEHDPKAAAWIRELIAAKLIPDGIVDERSILEIQPHELTRYTQCHFFAGIAGWSLALTLAGWPATRPVWTGSCPCQPFSNAGKGLAQADERHLWPAFFNLIRECRPECVIGEQVESAIGKGWLDGIQTDLEGEGYALGSVVLGAHSLGAPHIRQRLFWVADSAGGQRQQRLRSQGHELQRSADDCADGRLGDALIGGQRGRDERGLGAAGQQVGEPENGARAANEPRDGREDACGLALPESGHRRALLAGKREGLPDAGRTGQIGGLGDAASGGRGERGNEAQPGCGGHADSTGGARVGGLADTGHAESSRRELHTEGSDRGARDEPAPYGADGDGLADELSEGQQGRLRGREDAGREDQHGHAGRGGAAWDSFDILPCRDGKARRIESGTFPLVDGIPGDVVPGSDPSVSEAQATAESRVARLRGYGNAIVPQVAAEFVIAYLEIKSEL